MEIEDLIVSLSEDPFNYQKNFEVALEYDRRNQIASAVSFYLRTVEYGPEKESPIVYASLIKMAICFSDQKDRKNAVNNSLMQAIAYWPQRPEAYFYISQFHERERNWQECYAFSEIGLSLGDFEPLPGKLGYLGRYCLEFQKAASAYWIGRKEESIKLFLELKTRDVSKEYKKLLESNLRRLNIE